MNCIMVNQKNDFLNNSGNLINTRLRISHYIFALALLVKQFYLLPSGSFQIGDALFILSLICFLAESKFRLVLRKNDYAILAYVGCVAIINMIYSFIEGYNFNKATLYYLFSLIVIVTFVNLNSELYSKKFLLLLSRISKLSICIQVLAFVSGLGRWYAGSRYEGTFNDPNQYGVFILFSMFLIVLIDSFYQKKTIIWLIVCTFLIFISASTGMLVGLAAFFAVGLYYRMKENRFMSYFLPLVILILFTVLICIINGVIVVDLPSTNNAFLNRIINKYNSMILSNGFSSIVSDRGWTRVLECPEFLLYGSGEGGYSRFGTSLEIHSSVLGPLFYYGIIPFCLYIYWCFSKIKYLDPIYYCIFVGLFLESVFLVNTRQPLFWILFLLAETISQYSSANNKSNSDLAMLRKGI